MSVTSLMQEMKPRLTRFDGVWRARTPYLPPLWPGRISDVVGYNAHPVLAYMKWERAWLDRFTSYDRRS